MHRILQLAQPCCHRRSLRQQYGGGLAASATVLPGYDAGYEPYGSCNAATFYSVTGWTTNHDWDYGYGAIKLNCSVGDTVGWFGMYWTDFSEQGSPITITGYPIEKVPSNSMPDLNSANRITEAAFDNYQSWRS